MGRIWMAIFVLTALFASPFVGGPRAYSYYAAQQPLGEVTTSAAGSRTAATPTVPDDVPLPIPPKTEAPARGPAATGVAPIPAMSESGEKSKDSASPSDEPAPLDLNVQKTQGLGEEKNPLPSALEPGVARVSAETAGEPDPSRSGGPFVLPTEKLTLGKQSASLSVDVRSPPVVNMNKETELQVIVKNTGTTDAHGVVVRDELPPNVAFISSEPSANASGPVLFWSLNTMAAGSERIIKLRVKPTAPGSFEHAATVTMIVGGKSSTRINQPRLKVEATSMPSTVLKGQQVRIKVTLSNPGTGPARDVLLKARLSSGLKYDEGDGTLTIRKAVVEPGKPLTLESEEEQLILDAVAGGNQTVSFEATSRDVFDIEEGKTVVPIKVVEPKLVLTATGPKERVTDTPATYTFKVENTGDAPARKVKVVARVPDGMKVTDNANDPEPVWDSVARTLTWDLGLVDPNKSVAPWFRVQTGGVGIVEIPVKVYIGNAQADKKVVTTDIKGVADLVVDVTPRNKALDVGEKTTFTIRLMNEGSKDANKVAVTVEFSKNLKIISATPVDGKQATPNEAGNMAHFSEIERLPFSGNTERRLAILVEATAAGQATCEVKVAHDDLETPLRAMAVTKVYNGSGDARR